MHFGFFGTLSLALAIAAPPAAHAITVATAADVRALMNQRIEQTPGVGMVIGVIDHGKTVIYKTGETGNSSALDEHTLFEVGSVSKTFTATILASMVLDGSVKLDDPVAKYLPATVRMPSRNGKQITLLDLATQHSGLPRLPANMDFADPSDPYADYTFADLYKFLDTYTLTRDPGQSFEYSNLGLGLLGDALAARAGVTYDVLLHKRVLAPLGMNDTGIALSATQRSRFAVGHDADGQTVKSWTFQALAPAGAIRSTVADMLKYLRCNMGEGPLARACLFAQHPRSTFPGNRIGLVWWTGDVTPIIHHGGDTAGYHASVAVSPDREVGVVALTNGGLPVDDVAVHVIDPALPVAQWSKVAQLDAATLQSYVGRYDLRATGGILTVTRSGDRVFARLTGQPAAGIYPSAKDTFRYRVVDAQLDFSRNPAGDVSSVVLHQNGHEISGAKLSASAADPTTAPATPSPAPASPSASTPVDLDEYVGTYVIGVGEIFTISRNGDQLSVQLTGQPAIPIYPSAGDTFNARIVDAQIFFKRDAQGKISALELRQNGVVALAPRSSGALPQPSYPPIVKLDDATLDEYLGTYAISPGAVFTVTRTTDQLVVQLTGQASAPVYASAKDEFFYKIVFAQISFVRDASGKVTGLILHQNGRDISAAKM
jgi:serine-type D-Ala-D-Ala carboxypeptidase/endopeptidase